MDVNDCHPSNPNYVLYYKDHYENRVGQLKLGLGLALVLGMVLGRELCMALLLNKGMGLELDMALRWGQNFCRRIIQSYFHLPPQKLFDLMNMRRSVCNTLLAVMSFPFYLCSLN